MQTFLFVAGLLTTLVLVVALALTYLWPEHLGALHLEPKTAQMVDLNLISLLLLLAWLQRNLSPTWRTFTLAGAFIVLAESCLIAIT